MIQIEISGVPAGKGSMTPYARQRQDGSWYGIATHSTKSKSWEKEIRRQVESQVVGEVLPLDGALGIDLLFQLPRPKTVRRSFPSVVPDIDKLARSVLDALKGVIVDDSRVVDLVVKKRYAEAGDEGVWITISELDEC